MKVISTSGSKPCYETASSTDTRLVNITRKHTVCKGEDIKSKTVKNRALQTYENAVKFCGPDGLNNMEITELKQDEFFTRFFWTGVWVSTFEVIFRISSVSNVLIKDTLIKAIRYNQSHFEYNGKLIEIDENHVCTGPLFKPFQSVVMMIENNAMVVVSVNKVDFYRENKF